MIGTLFWLFLIAALAVIVRCGGGAERWFAALLLLATLATAALGLAFGLFRGAEMVAWVDVALLLAAFGCLFRLDKFWPAWFAGFQSITVAAELAKALFPNDVPGLYVVVARFWSLPAIAAVAIGVFLDFKAGAPASRSWIVTLDD